MNLIVADSNNIIHVEWICSWFYNLRLLVLLKKLCGLSLGEHVPLATGTNLDGFIGLTTVFLKPLLAVSIDVSFIFSELLVIFCLGDLGDNMFCWLAVILVGILNCRCIIPFSFSACSLWSESNGSDFLGLSNGSLPDEIKILY